MTKDSVITDAQLELSEAERQRESDRARWVHSPIGRAIVPLRRWWRDSVVDEIDYADVIAKIAGESTATARYIFMVMMSAGIAILGLLLSSPAVVIGAMLLSPLMSPILGVGFALASGKQKWLRLSAKALAIGSVTAVLFTALIVLLSPLQGVTAEIASRTQPNLFDLLIAFFSSLAGSYAMIRGREGTIVGVAIATALMPPLAVVGFGLATFNWTVFGGALALFFTNFLTIALTATVMARLYGFRTDLSSRQGWFQSIGIFAIFLAMAIPLGLSLSKIAFQTNAQRVVKNVIQDEFGARARISEQQIDWSSNPLAITATVLTPNFQTDANDVVSRQLKRQLGTDVNVSIEQFQVGADPGAAEQAALAQARASEQAAAAEREINNLADSMALVAGVDRSAVMLDRDTHTAMATAATLPGLTLAGYRDLEKRVGDIAPHWSIILRPPARPLPEISLTDGKPDAAGQQAIALIGWAAQRTGNTVALSGPADATDAVAQQLAKSGIAVTTKTGRGSVIAASWSIEAPAAAPAG